jgi:predicted nucleic acid-binding protein
VIVRHERQCNLTPPLTGVPKSPVQRRMTLDLFRSVEAGEMTGVASDLVLGELIVRPLRLGRTDVAERYLKELPAFPNLSFRRVSREAIAAAAELRARAPVGLVDALHLAGAIGAGATAFMTNDPRLARHDFGIEVVLLGDLET